MTTKKPKPIKKELSHLKIARKCPLSTYDEGKVKLEKKLTSDWEQSNRPHSQNYRVISLAVGQRQRDKAAATNGFG